MYIGHGRLCVCLSLAAFPHYCMVPDVTWGNVSGCPIVVHYWADLQSVHGFRCYDNSAEREMSANACTRCMPGLNLSLLFAVTVETLSYFLCCVLSYLRGDGDFAAAKKNLVSVFFIFCIPDPFVSMLP